METLQRASASYRQVQDSCPEKAMSPPLKRAACLRPEHMVTHGEVLSSATELPRNFRNPGGFNLNAPVRYSIRELACAKKYLEAL